jgi:hypothetical protein
MLEGLSRPVRHLAFATRCPSAPARGGLGPGDSTFYKSSDGRALEFSRGATCRFLSAVDGIAKHFCYRGGAPQKVDLKTVSLFFRTPLCIDTSNVFFGLWIRSAAHNDKDKLQAGENQRFG